MPPARYIAFSYACTFASKSNIVWQKRNPFAVAPVIGPPVRGALRYHTQNSVWNLMWIFFLRYNYVKSVTQSGDFLRAVSGYFSARQRATSQPDAATSCAVTAV